jgi:cysteinyl-tRNA synthetase
MSKSAGGFLTLQSLIDKGYDPLDYRYFLLGGHYRSQLQFSWDSLEGAKNARRSLTDRIKALAERSAEAASRGSSLEKAGPLPDSIAMDGKAPDSVYAGKAGTYLAAFDKALEDDLSTPRALAELWGLLRDAGVDPADALNAAFDMDRVLGLNLAEAARRVWAAEAKPAEDEALVQEIEGLIAERAAAKKAKDFARADGIRSSLKEKGIILEDSPTGTTWRRN